MLCFSIFPITITDITSVLTLVGIVIGGIFSFQQWRKDQELKRADYLNTLVERMRTDKDIKTVYQILDYIDDEKWYTKDFHNSEKEQMFDRALSFFSYICYLREQKIIIEEEMCFFEYGLKRILTNPQMQYYLYNIYHFSRRNGVKPSFYYLINYGSEKFFNKDFIDSRAWEKKEKYNRYLNF